MQPEELHCHVSKDLAVFVEGDDIQSPGGFPIRGAWFCEDCEMVFPNGGRGVCPYCQSRSVSPLTRSVMPLSAVREV